MVLIRTRLFAILLAASPAQASMLLLGVGTPSGSSPTGCTPNGSDGFAGAPVGGTFQQVNFFTSYAPQNGQTFTARPTWCVAGVDYPVGIPSSVTLVDPATTPPTGCTYAANVLTCSGASRTISGLDLSLHNGVSIDITSCTGNWAIKNNYWLNGTATQALGVQPWLEIELGSSPTCNMAFDNNVLDGNANNNTGAGQTTPDAIKNFSTGTWEQSYNAFLRQSGRFFFGPGSFTSHWNYRENQNYTSGSHGEWTIFNALLTTHLTLPLISVTYDTFLQGSTYGGGMTSPIYASSGSASNSLTISNVDAENNVVVNNAFQVTGGISGTTLTITASTSNQNGAGDSVFSLPTFGATSAIGISSGGPGSTGTFTLNASAPTVAPGSTIQLQTISAPFVEVGYDTVTAGTVKNNWLAEEGSLGAYTKSVWVDTGTVNTPTPTLSNNLSLLNGASVP